MHLRTDFAGWPNLGCASTPLFRLKETADMPILLRSISGLALVAAGLVVAAGVYTESHHAPDQS